MYKLVTRHHYKLVKITFVSLKRVRVKINIFIRNYWQTLLSLIPIIIFFVYVRYKSQIEHDELNRYYKITIATVVDCFPSKGGTYHILKYTVNDTNYEMITSHLLCGPCSRTKTCIGNKYDIMYFPPNPKNCRLISYEPVE